MALGADAGHSANSGPFSALSRDGSASPHGRPQVLCVRSSRHAPARLRGSADGGGRWNPM